MGARTYAHDHIAAFNRAVADGDFRSFLERFADDATMRLENVPGAGDFEFKGRSAIAAAYAEQPPDDQIDLAGSVREEDGAIVIPFVWRRDGAAGTLRLTLGAGLIEEMTITFAARQG